MMDAFFQYPSRWRLQAGRSQPFLHMGSCVDLPRFADQVLMLDSSRGTLGFHTKAFGLCLQALIQ
jgi:hypothetical protein